MDVHGQSEHFFLLSEENQLKVVDGLIGVNADEIKSKLSVLISEKKELKRKISALGGNEAERERRLDLLNYQIREIEVAELREGEFEELKSRQNIIANTEKILSALNEVAAIINDDGGCADSISSVKHCLGGISSLNDDYSKLYDRIESLKLEIEDVSQTVTDLAEDLSFDGREAQEIEERLTLLKSLRKKYGADENEILMFLQDARQQAELLTDSAAIIDKCSKEIEQKNKEIYSLCRELSKLRKECSTKFAKSVVAELKTLNIVDAAFSVEFVDYSLETADLNSFDGSDRIRFMFSANRGEPLKPLNKVISGGEMSRFMLAVKTLLKDVNGISTYIFDEIDSGISGITANTVARKFIAISKNTQILAVSHLPQVCAASDAQFLIFKTEENGKTFTQVKRLDEDSKIKELVRLTGGVESEAAIKHAKELINELKNN